jgi:hypothetical protein
VFFVAELFLKFVVPVIALPDDAVEEEEPEPPQVSFTFRCAFKFVL